MPIIILKKAEAQERENIRKLGPRLLFSGMKDLLQKPKERRVPLYLRNRGSSEHVENALHVAETYYIFESIHCGINDKINTVKALIKTAFLINGCF